MFFCFLSQAKSEPSKLIPSRKSLQIKIKNKNRKLYLYICVYIYIFIYIYTDWNPPAFEKRLEMNFGLLLQFQNPLFKDILPIFPGYFLPQEQFNIGSSLMGREKFLSGFVTVCFYFGDLGGTNCSFPLRRVTP